MRRGERANAEKPANFAPMKLAEEIPEGRRTPLCRSPGSERVHLAQAALFRLVPPVRKPMTEFDEGPELSNCPAVSDNPFLPEPTEQPIQLNPLPVAMPLVFPPFAHLPGQLPLLLSLDSLLEIRAKDHLEAHEHHYDLLIQLAPEPGEGRVEFIDTHPEKLAVGGQCPRVERGKATCLSATERPPRNDDDTRYCRSVAADP